MSHFDHLEDILNSPVRSEPGKFDAPVYSEPCKKCNGTGRFHSWSGRTVGDCFTCKGTGKITFKTSPEKRKAYATKALDSQMANLEAFKAMYPDEYAWLTGDQSEFSVSLISAIQKYGDLTEKQLTAVQRSVAKKAEALAMKEAREAEAKTVEMGNIEKAFAAASSTLKRPKLRAGGLIISYAPSAGANAGSLYVKERDIYLGKITNAKFIRSRECSSEQEDRLMAVAHDPLAASIAHGRLTGNCACCGRGLTNKESIERGIGPVCAEKFGW